MLFVNVVAAFCAAEKTDEKNPPAPPGKPEAAGVRPPGVFVSSTVGVRGEDHAFDNLLGAWVAESDRILRCEIMFPDAEVVMFAFVPGEVELLAWLICPSPRASVGVGGVVVKTGASLDELARDFGDEVTMAGMLCML